MPCMVPVVRQQGEIDAVEKEVQPVPRAVEAVLKEFADVMPKELPNTLPPRREVDHAIELEPGTYGGTVSLRLPDLSKPFEVHTDASDFAIGGVLMRDGHPLAFESRKLNDTERRYTRVYVPRWDNARRELREGLYLRHYVSANQRNWAKLMDVARFSYNLQRSESTGSSPFELATGTTTYDTEHGGVGLHGE
ncbi:unnamed protein product [Prunus brigantina]